MAFHLIHANGRSLLASDRPLLRDQERAPITDAVALLGAVRGWHDEQALALAEARDALEDVVEPFLIQQGFIQRTPRGRLAAARAWEHLGLAPPQSGNTGQTGLFGK